MAHITSLGVKKKKYYRDKDIPKKYRHKYYVNIKTGDLTDRNKGKGSYQERVDDPGATAYQVEKPKALPTRKEPETIHLGSAPEKKGEIGKVDMEKWEEGKATAGILAGGVGFKGGGKVAQFVTSPATFKKMKSGFGLLKMSGKAGTLKASKLIAIPGKEVRGIPKKAPAAFNYANNAKSSSLTTKMLIGAGLSLGTASILKDLVGTYPFASFGKEETLQSMSFVMNNAINAGLYEEAQEILSTSNEIVDAAPSIAERIPYLNVQKEFQRYIVEQKKVNEVWAKIIEKGLGEQSGEVETDFAAERRASDEAATQRKLEEQAQDAEYFRLIREKKFDEAEELLQSRLKG